MRRIKYLLWLIIAAVLFAFAYQNRDFFAYQRDLGIDLYVFRYSTPAIPTGLYFLAVFAIGLLISYFANLAERFRNRKTIRQLNDRLGKNEKRINELEAELASRPAVGHPEPPAMPPGDAMPH